MVMVNLPLMVMVMVMVMVNLPLIKRFLVNGKLGKLVEEVEQS